MNWNPAKHIPANNVKELQSKLHRKIPNGCFEVNIIYIEGTIYIARHSVTALWTTLRRSWVSSWHDFNRQGYIALISTQ